MKIRSKPQPVVSSLCFHPYPTFPRRGGRLPSAPPLGDCVAMRNLHECHSEPQAKNLTIPDACEGEILRLAPQDDIATQSLDGEDTGGVNRSRNPISKESLRRLRLV